MAFTNSLVVEGLEKEVYEKNIVEGLEKLNREENLEGIKKLCDIFRVYYLDDHYKTNIYKKIQVNGRTGFPVNDDIKRILKNGELVSTNNNKNILEEIKSYLGNEKDLESIMKEFGGHFFFSERKKLDILKSTYEIFTNVSNIDIIEYYNQPLIYKIKVKQDDDKDISIVEKLLKNKGVYNVPRSLGNFFQFLYNEANLTPESIEVGSISFLNLKVESDPNIPNLKNTLKNNPNSYIIRYDKEKVNIQKNESYESGFLGIKRKRYTIDRSDVTDSKIYVCNKDIYGKIVAAVTKDENSKLVT